HSARGLASLYVRGYERSSLIFLYRLVRFAFFGRRWGSGKLVVSCYPKSTYAGVRQRWCAVAATRLKTWLSTMTLCRTMLTVSERSLTRRLSPPHVRIC